MRAARRFREAELLEIGAGWDEDVPAAGADRGLARGLSGLMTALAGAGLLALAVAQPPPAEDTPRGIADLLARPDPVLTAPPPAWRELEIPQIVLGLDAPGIGGLASRHAARVHSGGAREDALVFGSFAEGDTHLRVTLHRAAPDTALEAPRAFFVEVALAAAEAGLAIASSGQPEAVRTGFGTLEAAPLVLENGPVRACLAFRGGDGPRLSGWLCAEEATPARLACLVDGLVLLDPGGDAALAEAFSRASAARAGSGCADRGDPATVAAIAARPPAAAPAVDPAATLLRVTAPAPPPRPARLGASS
ncbi:hypothetical protein [Salinarimonas rosea]|uniref:hypothetical protein n=1 Tax=Salinarimonas rosea TaxID=552063 RepID=UPI000422118C|nr:hypothetical protein [Salinarimonas rosea]